MAMYARQTRAALGGDQSRASFLPYSKAQLKLSIVLAVKQDLCLHTDNKEGEKKCRDELR